MDGDDWEPIAPIGTPGHGKHRAGIRWCDSHLDAASDHWADFALDWLEEGCPAQAQIGVLDRLSVEPGRAQRTRHRARRVWKRVSREAFFELMDS